jgi:Peptidase A4 family
MGRRRRLPIHEQIQEHIGAALGVRVPTRRAPEDFNPLEATARQLAAFGYPPRPDARRHPELHERWRQLFGTRITMIEPHLAVMADTGRPVPGRPATPANSPNIIWSGSVAGLQEGNEAAWVTGAWTVPDIFTPGWGDYVCALWVGIDGWGTPALVQAGTSVSRLTHSQQTFAWYEWLPEDPVRISNLPVARGDYMSCTICATSPTEASFYLLNHTSRIGTSLRKTAPADHEMVFQQAEWILELPQAEPPFQLPPYGEVYFEGYAGTPDHAVYLPGEGELLDLVFAGDGTQPRTRPIISKTTAVTDRLLNLTYTGWDTLER